MLVFLGQPDTLNSKLNGKSIAPLMLQVKELPMQDLQEVQHRLWVSWLTRSRPGSADLSGLKGSPLTGSVLDLLSNKHLAIKDHKLKARQLQLGVKHLIPYAFIYCLRAQNVQYVNLAPAMCPAVHLLVALARFDTFRDFKWKF